MGQYKPFIRVECPFLKPNSILLCWWHFQIFCIQTTREKSLRCKNIWIPSNQNDDREFFSNPDGNNNNHTTKLIHHPAVLCAHTTRKQNRYTLSLGQSFSFMRCLFLFVFSFSFSPVQNAITVFFFYFFVFVFRTEHVSITTVVVFIDKNWYTEMKRKKETFTFIDL